MQAPTIVMGPAKVASVGVPVQDKTAAPITRQAIPSAMRRSKFSWKMNHAISAVAAPSSVRSNKMKGDHTKNRVTVYYLLAEHFGKLPTLS